MVKSVIIFIYKYMKKVFFYRKFVMFAGHGVDSNDYMKGGFFTI